MGEINIFYMKIKKAKIKAKITKKIKNQDSIMSLAHAGTKEAVAKIKAYIAKEKDENKKAMAELALDECQLFYYEPTNEKEEGDYYLLKLISRKENRLTDRYVQLFGLECEVKFVEQELRVVKAISEKVKKKDKEAEDIGVWVAQDSLTTTEQRLKELQDWIKEDEVFIETARGLITTERYKNIPKDFIDHIHFDNECLNKDFEEDEYCCDDCNERDCCCEDCGYCGSCSEFEETE